MELSYKQLGPAEIEPAQEILRLCGLDMQERLGLSHWVPAYPLEAMRRSAQERQVYAVLHEDQVIATFTIGTEIPAFYKNILPIWEMWGMSAIRALYVNHLAILPSLQGQGLGRQCMQRIERFAIEQACEAIRLDAYAGHPGLHIFYPKLGFQPRGLFSVHTERHGYGETICYEKLKQDFS